MAKQYHRRQSGLILPDDTIAVPKPDLPRPWYAGRITANRAMSRRKCCCGGCTYFTDDFDRSDSSDLGSNWTEEAGSWSISSSNLVTASSNAIALCTQRASGSWFDYVIAATISGTDGDHVRIYFSGTNYVDIWWYSGYTVCTAGSTTKYVSGTQNSFKMCVHEDHIIFGTPDFAFSANIVSTTTEAGVGTGAISGTVTVSSFSLSTYDESSAACFCSLPCNQCTDSPPTEISVTLTGVGNGSGTGECSNCCPDFNDTFILHADSTCSWGYTFPECECGIAPCYFKNFSLDATISWHVLTVRYMHQSTICEGGNSYWSKDFGDVVPCREWNEEELTFGGTMSPCSVSDSTCTVTAL